MLKSYEETKAAQKKVLAQGDEIGYKDSDAAEGGQSMNLNKLHQE